jgi:predicted DNA-binding antitoxin AbrB/MazE fold protein
MIEQVEAVYEHGVLRPLKPLSLAESQRVNLTISEVVVGRSQADLEFLERVRAEVAAMPHVPTLEEVRKVMSKIPGSMAAEIIASREER